MSKFRDFLRCFRRPTIHPHTRIASIPASLLAVSMATYTTTVTKLPELAVPDDAAAKPHHISKRGNVVGFKNPYESFATGISFSKILRTVLWCVPWCSGSSAFPLAARILPRAKLMLRDAGGISRERSSIPT